MQVWPFMFAKNEVGAGWTAVVVPSVIVDREGRRLLLQAQQGLTVNSDEALYFEGRHSKLGAADLIYREGEERKDESGRPFRPAEGFLILKPKRNFVFLKEHFDEARMAMQPMYDAFWRQTSWSDEDSRFPTPIELKAIAGGTPISVSPGQPTSNSLPKADARNAPGLRSMAKPSAAQQMRMERWRASDQNPISDFLDMVQNVRAAIKPSPKKLPGRDND